MASAFLQIQASKVDVSTPGYSIDVVMYIMIGIGKDATTVLRRFKRFVRWILTDERGQFFAAGQMFWLLKFSNQQ